MISGTWASVVLQTSKTETLRNYTGNCATIREFTWTDA
ncbi:hypothetical protein Mpsy_1649 [Methanolobus psychrophilus R15]|nr:hypothetical protein Mpsy_1649 [Methanolobus psychrophilus R15]